MSAMNQDRMVPIAAQKVTRYHALGLAMWEMIKTRPAIRCYNVGPLKASFLCRAASFHRVAIINNIWKKALMCQNDLSSSSSFNLAKRHAHQLLCI